MFEAAFERMHDRFVPGSRHSRDKRLANTLAGSSDELLDPTAFGEMNRRCIIIEEKLG